MTLIDYLKRLFGPRKAADTSGAAAVVPPDTSGKPTVAPVPSESGTDSEAGNPQDDTPT